MWTVPFFLLYLLPKDTYVLEKKNSKCLKYAALTEILSLYRLVVVTLEWNPTWLYTTTILRN